MSVASVVIPAHNEEATIGRSLVALRSEAGSDELDVVVVCNGCTDETAAAARRCDTQARVIEIAEASKAEAVRVGNAATTVFPRVHLDADIELTGSAVRALLAPLTEGRALATAPQREIPRDGCSRLVGWYYDVWEELPNVQAGLFGRGVVAVTAAGQDRLSALPRLLSDDLAMSESFYRCGATGRARRRRRGASSPHGRGPRASPHPGRHRQRAGRSCRRSFLVVSYDGSRPVALAVTKPGLALRIPVFLAVYLAASSCARRAVRAGTSRRGVATRARADDHDRGRGPACTAPPTSTTAR